MKTFFIILFLIIVVLLCMAGAAFVNGTYIPKHGDILKTDDGKWWSVLSWGPEHDTVMALEIDPVTEDVIFDAKSTVLKFSEFHIVRLNNRSK